VRFPERILAARRHQKPVKQRLNTGLSYLSSLVMLILLNTHSVYLNRIGYVESKHLREYLV